jgi:replication factor A1
MGGANQFGQRINTCGGLFTPVSAAWNVQKCMACGSSGHNAQNCPAVVRRQQQPAASSYTSSPGNAAATGGYNRQSYAGASNC